MSLFSLDLMML